MKIIEGELVTWLDKSDQIKQMRLFGWEVRDVVSCEGYYQVTYVKL